MWADYVQSDFYLITEEDINNGIFIPFNEPWYGSGQFYASVEMYSNGDETPIYLLDDETYMQADNSSMIYIPADQVYTNGNAIAIRLVMGSQAIIEGCTDPAACNYNSFVNTDDGSCEYLESGQDCISGCLDSEACNYNENANFNDGSCLYLDGICESCENGEVTNNDSDNDGICDVDDACPNDPENDIDNDGLCAENDPMPY